MVFENLGPEQYIVLFEGAYKLINGQQYGSFSINKNAMRIIKTALANQRNRLTDPQYLKEGRALTAKERSEVDDVEAVLDAWSKGFDKLE